MTASAKTARKVQKKKQNTAFRDYFLSRGGFDVPFLIIVIALVSIGLLMMFSASSAYSYYYKGDSLYYFKRQLMFAVAGIFFMFLASRISTDVLKHFAKPLLAVAFGLLVVVLFVTPPAGFEDFHRWIVLGPITFQPSEIAKFALILYLAADMDKHFKGINSNEPSDAKWAIGFNQANSKFQIRTRYVTFFLYAAVIIVMAALVYKENHVSGAVLILLLGFMMMFLAGFKWYTFAGIIAVGLVVVVAVINNPDILPEHAAARIVAWLDKSYDPLGDRWQTNQALYAIGSGGLFGVGLGNSKMKQLYVSEPQNDFIFSIICEELGVVGAALILALFIALVYRGFMIGTHCRDKFSALLSMGIVFQVGLQTALNIAVVTDMFPNTGISLPFFSYGGTSLMMLLFEMGIVLSISRNAALKKA